MRRLLTGLALAALLTGCAASGEPATTGCVATPTRTTGPLVPGTGPDSVGLFQCRDHWEQ